MNFAPRDSRSTLRVRCASLITALLLAATALAPLSAHAEGLSDQAHSLALVPADAAFYSVSLRQKEQFDIFLASKAYSRLMEVPIVQLAKMQIGFQWQQSPQPAIAKIREYVESEEGQRAVALAKQLFAEESFVYTSSDVARLLQVARQFGTIDRQANVEAMSTGRDKNEIVAERAYALFEKHADDLHIPDIVFGFHIDDRASATQVLDHFHSLLADLLEEKHPELTGCLEREQIADHEFLTLRLDGSMIPWDELRAEHEELDDEQFEKWKSLLADKRVAVALGVVDEFLLLSVSDSTDHLKTIGQGETLANNSFLARLNKHASQRLTSITFLSESLAGALSSPQRTADELVGMADDALQSKEIDEENRTALLEDLRSLGADVVKYLPTPGVMMGVTYLTPRGYEGYQYNLGTQPMLVSSEPLTILGHVGGSPLFFAASHSEQSVEAYDKTVDLVSKVATGVEKIVEQQASPEDWTKYLEYRDEILDLLGRLNRTTREQLFSALAGGQQALVLDVATTSTQWFDAMPESPGPLPMLELGVAFGVSDEEKLRQGVAELFSIVGDTAALLHKANPDEVPAIDLPEPEVDARDDATFYSFALPDKWGISSQIAVNGGITDSAAAVSLMPDFTERLLRSVPLKIDTSIDMDRPAAKATHIEVAKVVEAIRPWLDYGFDVAMGKINGEDEYEDDDEAGDEEEPVDPQQQARIMQMGFVLPQVHQILNVLTAIDNHTSITYQEDDAWVTHSEMYLKDLE